MVLPRWVSWRNQNSLKPSKSSAFVMLHSGTTPWEVCSTIPSATANETTESWSVTVKIQVFFCFFCFFCVIHGFYNCTQYHPDPSHWPWVKVTFMPLRSWRGILFFKLGCPFVRLFVRLFVRQAFWCMPYLMNLLKFIYRFLMKNNSCPIFFLSGKFLLLELCPFKNQNEILSARYLTIWARALKLCELKGDDEKFTWSWRGILIFKLVFRSFVCPFVTLLDAYHI